MSQSPYREHILDHFENPRHKHTVSHPDHAGEADNPVCGDRVRLEIRLDHEGRVAEAGFSGEGCVICMAAASMLAEYIEGRDTCELEQMAEQDVLALLGVELGRARTQCATVSLRALKSALQRE